MNLRITITIFFIVTILNRIYPQCANANNIYSFPFKGHTYEVVKENKTWLEAVNCALSRGGYLAKITDSTEQDTLFDYVINKSNITFTNTLNIFGTSAIWLGGTDTLKEGAWIWDGNNDGIGIPFWSGGPTGTSINGSYTKWGISPAEPDNSGRQNHLCLTIDNRKINYGRWNDIKSNDHIYYLIEYDQILDVNDPFLKFGIRIYPNPVHEILNVENPNHLSITEIHISNPEGQILESIYHPTNKINVSNLQKGIYFIALKLEDHRTLTLKFIKD